MDTTEPVHSRKTKKQQLQKKIEIICSDDIECELSESDSEDLDANIKDIRSKIKKRK